jgi:hypothetical protein
MRCDLSRDDMQRGIGETVFQAITFGVSVSISGGESRNSVFNGRYLELVTAFPLASIKSERHLAHAQKAIDGLLAKDRLNAGEETYLDALSDLVASYEDDRAGLGCRHAAAPARRQRSQPGRIEPPGGNCKIERVGDSRRQEIVQSADDPQAGGLLSRRRERAGSEPVEGRAVRRF